MNKNNELVSFLSDVNKLMNESVYREISNTKDKLDYLLDNEAIREKICWVLPNIIDITEQLNLSQEEGHGKVYALSFPDVSPDINLKTPIFAGLFLLQVMQGIINEKTEVIVEAGGINTGYGLKKLIEIFNLKGQLYTSRYFSERVLDELKADNFNIIQPEAREDLALEEEFYVKFVEDLKELRKNGNIAPLWHVKKSFMVAEILAEKMYSKNKNVFDDMEYLITGMGSGGSLSAFCKILDISSNKNLKIIVPEHEKSPILWDTYPKEDLSEMNIIDKNLNTDNFYNLNSKRVPHIVFGPHYEKINNKIPQKYLDSIDGISLYSDEEWKNISSLLDGQNISVGNSSSANLVIAKKLALKGKNIITFIYESKRKYSKALLND